MDILALAMRGNWGDSIGKLWISEYIKAKVPNAKIWLDDTELEGPYSRWFNITWTEGRPISKTYDYHISTHHRHWWAGDFKIPGIKPLWFDLHGFVFKMVNENWFPTFTPTPELEMILKGLQLPQEYLAIHYIANDGRYGRVGAEGDYAQYLTKYNLPVISTGDPIPNATNLKALPGWVKLAILIRSKIFLGSHSGFTAIASVYRKTKDSYLINYSYPLALYLGPPVVSFSNVNYQTHNVEKLYTYAREQFDWTQYPIVGKDDSLDSEYYRHNSQYEGLNFQNWNSIQSINATINEIHFEQENALVPQDTIFSIDELPPRPIVPNNFIKWGGGGMIQERLYK